MHTLASSSMAMQMVSRSRRPSAHGKQGQEVVVAQELEHVPGIFPLASMSIARLDFLLGELAWSAAHLLFFGQFILPS